MKKLSILFAALLTCTMSFAADYAKVTSAPSDWSGKYILVYENSTTEAYVWTGVDAASGYTTATIANNKVSGDNFVTITIASMEGGYSIKVNNGTNSGKYIYGTSGKNVINFSGSASLNTLEYETTGAKITSNTSVMRFYVNSSKASDNRFRYYKSSSYSSQKAIQLYKLVPVPATGLSLDQSSLTLDKGATAQLTATLTPSDATSEISWESSDANVATVKDGLITAVGVGNATITAQESSAGYTAVCSVTVVAAPDAPTFGVADDFFEGSMNVSLAAAEGMKIYYTTNGDDPTTASTLYSAPFEITATTTVKAIAYDETNSKESVVASKTYTKALTCAEANAAADDTKMMLNTVTVVYVNGSNIYVADATGGALVYAYNYGLKAGQVVKGLKGAISIYNKLPEVVPSSAFADLTITDGTVPEPTALTAVPTMDIINQYVRINGVTTTAATWKSSDSKSAARTMTAKLGDDDITLYNTFKIDQTFTADNYDIIGFVTCYNNTVRIAVVSATLSTTPPTSIENAEETISIQKVLRDGQVLLIRDGKAYNVMGQRVD